MNSPQRFLSSTPPVPPPQAEERARELSPTVKQGVIPDASKRQVARALAWTIAAAGIYIAVPPSVISTQAFVAGLPIELARWAFVLLFLTGLHGIYALYLGQLADWSTLRVLAVVMLICACLDGLVLGGLLVGGPEGLLSQVLQLQPARHRQGMLWSLAQLSLHGLLAYFCGREAFRWKLVFDAAMTR